MGSWNTPRHLIEIMSRHHISQVKVDGQCEVGPEEDGCHELEDMCSQKRRLEDGHEGDQGPTRTVEPWSVWVWIFVYQLQIRYYEVFHILGWGELGLMVQYI
jgi:hypothetical protein